jgi:hypothetical protein
MPWYLYNPIDSAPHNTNDPNNYNNVGTTPPSCPSPKTKLCSIQAPDNSGSPIISQALSAEISTAVNSGVETTNVKLRPTIFP